MNYPTKTFWGLTWVGWLNTLLLQWLFVRLQGVIDEIDRPSGGRLIVRNYWTLIFPVVPLTGWWSDYVPKRHREIWLGRRPPLEKVRGDA